MKSVFRWAAVWIAFQGLPVFAGGVELKKIPKNQLLQMAAIGRPWTVTHMICASTGIDVVGENNRLGTINLSFGLHQLTETVLLPNGGKRNQTYQIERSEVGPDLDLSSKPPGTDAEQFAARVQFAKEDPVEVCVGDCRSAEQMQTIMMDGLSGIDFHYYRPGQESSDKEERLVLVTKTLPLKFNVPGYNCNESDVILMTLRRIPKKQTE